MRRVLPIVLAAFGALLVAASMAWGLVSNAIANPSAVSLPDRVAGLPLTQTVTGQPAAEEFDSMHGEQFPVTSAAVGIYGDSQITIWAAGAPVNFMAAQLETAMHKKISQGQSPFKEVNTLRDGSRTVYALEGMGQKHYYFHSKNLVIWLAAEPALADEALRETLEAYP